jgi:proline iminopeptidase
VSDNTGDGDGSLLDVGDGHRVYVEAVGAGIPVVFLHGGPGSGFRPEQRKIFNPNRFRTIFFDQRGAGRSVPTRDLRANTTQHLINDLEAIRAAHAIERWVVVGGSWGATLGIAYAEQHPERVAGLVLRAVFFGTRRELDWAFLGGTKVFRPDLLADFLSLLSPDERFDPLEAYWRRILDPDPAIHGPARWAWHDTERVLSEVRPGTGRVQRRSGTGPMPATPLFEAHYFSNNCFLERDQLIRDAPRLAGIPGVMVQGRFDLLCPPTGSNMLAGAWPGAEIITVENAGHAMSEPGIRAALVDALDRVADRANV